MSLAQRRTTLDGIDVLPSPTFDEEEQDALLQGETAAGGEYSDDDLTPTPYHYHHDGAGRRGSSVSNLGSIAAGIPVEDGKEVWQALSYDPFQAPPVEPLHYESLLPEVVENVAAFEVSTARRIFQIAFAVLACVLASGIVCGFAALKPILIAEGVYRTLCPADWDGGEGESQVPCMEQDMRLNLFFITASITLNVSTVLAGYVLDHHGRRACYLLSALVLFLGAGCMSLAFYLGERLVWFDGYITGNLLLGLGGTFLFVSSYQLSNAFPRHAGLVVALVTGAFDASAAVFLFYRLAYEATSHTFRPATFFLVFALTIPPMILAAEFAIMPKSGYHTKREYQAAIAKAQDPAQDEHDSDAESYAYKPRELRRARARRASERGSRLQAIEAVAGTASERAADRDAARERRATSGVWGILRARSVARQMATPWFWLLLLVTVVQMTRMNYFIATVRAQYRFMLGSEEGAARINGLFDVALPVAGVVTTPFIGVLLNEVPVWVTLAVLTVLIALLAVLNCVRSLAAGYATVVVFVLYRPLYYSAVSDYATKVFGFATFGRIYGTMICVSGVGQLVQPALDALTHGLLENDPVPVNMVFGAVGITISTALTLYVYVKTRENEEKEEEEEGETEDERRALLNGDGNGDWVGGREYGAI